MWGDGAGVDEDAGVEMMMKGLQMEVVRPNGEELFVRSIEQCGEMGCMV